MSQRNPSAVTFPVTGGVILAVTTVGALLTVGFVENHTWQMTRATGLVAFVMLWLSVVLGLLQSTGYFRAPSIIDLHSFVSIWALYMTTFHIVVLLFDRHDPFSLAGILIPFAAAHHPLLNGIGGLAFYIALGVTVTTYFRGQIGATAWRAIHLTSLVSFLFALAHGLMLGTDAKLPTVAFTYRFAALSVAALLAYRTYLGVTKRANPVRRR
ncbi:MAG TPA: hypothetical protein VNT75_19255 [Symbiobacteriaceae bacterium]|nr:hypothetical protein [Symbiobacteriaceae bacterium]